MSQAVLGTEAVVRTITGQRKVNIPAGTAHGIKIRIPGEGVHKLSPHERERGDHFVVVNVAVPSKLTAEQKALYEQLKKLDEAAGGKTSEKKSWF